MTTSSICALVCQAVSSHEVTAVIALRYTCCPPDPPELPVLWILGTLNRLRRWMKLELWSCFIHILLTCVTLSVLISLAPTFILLSWHPRNACVFDCKHYQSQSQPFWLQRPSVHTLFGRAAWCSSEMAGAVFESRQDFSVNISIRSWPHFQILSNIYKPAYNSTAHSLDADSVVKFTSKPYITVHFCVMSPYLQLHFFPIIKVKVKSIVKLYP
jgi:hypothetical protein